MTYPSFLSEEAADLLKNLLVKKPADRFSCHEALRHPFFKKFGLDIEKEEKLNEEAAREQSVRKLALVIQGADRKLQPKVLSENQSVAPLSEVFEKAPKETSAKVDESPQSPQKKEKSKPRMDDTLELSQSVFLTESQIQEALSGVGWPYAAWRQSE